MAKTYTAAGTVVAGDVATAAAWNVVTADVNNLIVSPACRAYRTGATSYTSGAAMSFDLEHFDTDGMHNTVTNNDRITINTAGIYLITFAYTLNFNGTTTKEQTDLRVNASAITYDIKVGSFITNTANTVQAIWSCSVSDYIQATVSLTGASNITNEANGVVTSLGVVWLGQAA
jgi:hypothetical protein